MICIFKKAFGRTGTAYVQRVPSAEAAIRTFAPLSIEPQDRALHVDGCRAPFECRLRPNPRFLDAEKP